MRISLHTLALVALVATIAAGPARAEHDAIWIDLGLPARLATETNPREATPSGNVVGAVQEPARRKEQQAVGLTPLDARGGVRPNSAHVAISLGSSREIERKLDVPGGLAASHPQAAGGSPGKARDWVYGVETPRFTDRARQQPLVPAGTSAIPRAAAPDPSKIDRNTPGALATRR